LAHSQQASSDKKQLDVGANLFIGNLDENVDERLLYDTFSAFGMMATTAKVSSFACNLFPPEDWNPRLLVIPQVEPQKAMVLSPTQILKLQMPLLSL